MERSERLSSQLESHVANATELRMCECGRMLEMADTGIEIYWYCECGKMGPNKYYACVYDNDGDIDGVGTLRARRRNPEWHESERYWAKLDSLAEWNIGHVFDTSL